MPSKPIRYRTHKTPQERMNEFGQKLLRKYERKGSGDAIKRSDKARAKRKATRERQIFRAEKFAKDTMRRGTITKKFTLKNNTFSKRKRPTGKRFK